MSLSDDNDRQANEVTASTPPTPPKDDGNWKEYKVLVLKELERNEENFKQLILSAQENSIKLSNISQSITSINLLITAQGAREQKLENRVACNEREIAVLKTKIIFYGIFISMAATGLINLAFHFLKG